MLAQSQASRFVDLHTPKLLTVLRERYRLADLRASAVVADSMSGRRHRSNAELVAQGVANIGSALFGGFCVTGTIARTASNVHAGARGPIAGMAHAGFLLLFMVVAAPMAGYIPLAGVRRRPRHLRGSNFGTQRRH
jgi:SulP family sulfate permease